MKKFLAVIFSLGLLFSVASAVVSPGKVSSLAAGAVSLVGLFFVAESFRTSTANLQLVPAIMKVDGKPVPPMTRAEKALYDQLITMGRAPAATQEAILAGAITFDPISYYIRCNLTGLSGNQKFLSSSTTKSVGTTNFPNNATLPQFYNFCFDRIFVRTVITNTANTAVNTVAGWTSVSASMDPAVRNGELIIRSNRNVIVETPVVDFIAEAAVSGGGAREFGGGVLEKPRFFLELLGIEAEFALAGTVASTANTTTFAEVIFSGVQARLKS